MKYVCRYQYSSGYVTRVFQCYVRVQFQGYSADQSYQVLCDTFSPATFQKQKVIFSGIFFHKVVKML